MTLEAVLTRIDDTLPQALERLLELLRIPSISTDPAYKPDCARAADWLVEDLKALGFEASSRPTPGHPMVVAHGGTGERHLMFYGHYDVQPVDPLSLWDRDPFDPEIQDTPAGRVIRARGAADDKGQLMTFLEACRAWKAVHGSLPGKLTIFLEGEEESGSPSLIPFMQENATELPDTIRAQWQSLAFDHAKFLGDVGLSVPAGEQDRTPLEMIWSRPTAEINGIWGGYTGDGFKTVLPAEAHAKVSFRLVGEQDPFAIRDHFRTWVQDQLPADCRVEFDGHGNSPAGVMSIANPAFEAARAALTEEWGIPAAYVGCGGSIPIAGYFKTYLDMDAMLIGFGRDDDQIHSPNEKYDLECFHKGIRSWARVLARLA